MKVNSETHKNFFWAKGTLMLEPGSYPQKTTPILTWAPLIGFSSFVGRHALLDCRLYLASKVTTLNSSVEISVDILKESGPDFKNVKVVIIVTRS